MRNSRIASSCCLIQSLLSRSQATTSSAPALMSSPTPPRLPNSASANSQASPAVIATTPSRLAAMASPRETPRLVAQPINGSSWVLTRAATMSGTVAARAYQMAPPTRNTPAVIRMALALQLAIALPAAARAGASADMCRGFDAPGVHPPSGGGAEVEPSVAVGGDASAGSPDADHAGSLLHPWIVRRVGVHGRAAVIDRFRAQFVVPGFVAVDLAQPVLGAVL